MELTVLQQNIQLQAVSLCPFRFYNSQSNCSIAGTMQIMKASTEMMLITYLNE